MLRQGAIVHVGDVAGVPDQLVAGLTDLGAPAIQLRPTTPLAGARWPLKALGFPARAGWSRLLGGQARRARVALLHVHYATTAAPFAGCGVPLVVHAHGSDVRGAGAIARAVLRVVWRASALRLVATPDLLPEVPGAFYLPNPVDMAAFASAGSVTPTSDVLVFSALTEIKGADRLVAAVRALRATHPGVRVTALDAGPFAPAMRDAGAELIGRVTPDRIPALVAAHRVVLGQQRLGVPGVSELQAMATARPVVGHLRADLDYGTTPPPIVEAHEPEEIAAAAASLLDDPATAAGIGSSGARWVGEHHDRTTICRRLLALYQEHLGLSIVPALDDSGAAGEPESP